MAKQGMYHDALVSWKEAVRYIKVICEEKQEMNDEATKLYEQMVEYHVTSCHVMIC